MTSNMDVIWANRTAKAILAYPHSRRMGLPFRRHSEIPVSGSAGSGPFYEDRHSLAAAHGSFHRSHRDHLWCTPFSRSVYPPGLRASAHRHLRGLVLDQDRDVCEEWFLALHEARTDLSMLLGLIFLVIVGGGTLALDVRYPEGLDPKP
jgi:hypothetical protein